MTYITLIEKITGINISPKNSVNHDILVLDNTCDKFNSSLNIKSGDPMAVSIPSSNAIQEPCPICMSTTGEKDAALAWIGLNPHKDNPQFSRNTSWGALEDYHCCNALSEGNNVFKYVSGQSGLLSFSRYYKLLFRFLLSVYGESTLSSVGDLVSLSKKNGCKLDEFFLRYITENPIICAELFPFKTCEFPTDAKKIEALLKDERYRDYLDCLLDIVFNNVRENGYVVFFGANQAICRILEKKGVALPQPEIIENEKFWFFSHLGRRVIISPFIRPDRSKNYDLKRLMECLKNRRW